MLIGPEAHVSDEEGIKLDLSQYICIGLLILTALLLLSYILFIRCRYLRSRQCASCGQTVPISGRERVEGFWQRIWHEGCWKTETGEGREVNRSRRGRGRGGTGAGVRNGEGGDAEKGESEGISLIPPRRAVGSYSKSSGSSTLVTHTPTVSSPLTTSLPTLPYPDPSQPDSIQIAPALTPTARPGLSAVTSSGPELHTPQMGTASAPPSLSIPQPQLKPPPRQALLYIRQVQTYTPTTTTLLPPRSTSVYASSYSTLTQYDDDEKSQSGRILHVVREEEVPEMGRYKASQSVDDSHDEIDRGSQGLEVQVEALRRGLPSCEVAL